MGCAMGKKPSSKVHVTARVEKLSDLLVTGATFVQMNQNQFLTVYKVGPRIGQGSFAEVRKCELKATGQMRAVKICRKDLVGQQELQLILQEADIIKRLDHPNIIRLFELFEDPKRYYISMEYCPGGDLFDTITKIRMFSEEQAAHIIHQVLSVVAYCHEHGIAHRDLKPENILFEEKNKEMSVKIVDFGSATRFISGQPILGTVGTSYYIAPEVLSGRYNELCDEWSVGVILHILLAGKPPFEGRNDSEIIEHVRRCTFSLDIPELQNTSRDSLDLLRGLLAPAATRICAKEALGHTWFSQQKKTQVNAERFVNVMENLKHFGKGQKLREAVQTFIATQLLTTQETKELRTLFQAIDTNGDGKLSRQELIDEYQKTMSSEDAVREVDIIMEKVDSDKSGFIDYTEFLKASMDHKMMLNAETLTHAFSVFDADNSGKISADEIRRALGQELDSTDTLWREIIQEVDQNGDGEIDLIEFTAILKAKM